LNLGRHLKVIDIELSKVSKRERPPRRAAEEAGARHSPPAIGQITTITRS
jgi:hypothetical protein